MLFGDLKYAVRFLLKTPVTTIVCILTLAIGIGVNTAVFGILYTALLRPLPFPEFERLVAVSQINRRDGRLTLLSMPDFVFLEKGADSFQSLAGYHVSLFSLNIDGAPEQLNGSMVTPQFFAALRVPAVEGRTFLPGDPDGTAVISYWLWRGRFRGDPRLIRGSPVILDGRSVLVVGVMPPGFWFPDPKCQIWRLLTADSYLIRENQDFHFLRVLGRLRTSASTEQALAQVNVLNNQLALAHPNLNAGLGISIFSLSEALTKNARSTILILMTTAAFVLVIACVNVTSLQLSRILNRGSEFAVRTWLGATRSRIFRQLLVESLVLSVAGAATGLAFAAGGLRLALKLNPATIPRSSDVRIDLAVLAFNLMLCLAAGLFCSLASLSQFLGPSFPGSSSGPGARTTAGRKTRLLQHGLITAEVAAALVMLISVNLMVKSFVRLSTVDVGFNTSRLITLSVRLPKTNYPTFRELERFRREIYSSISAVSGVTAVAECSDLPLVAGFQNYFLIRGEPQVAPAEREMVLQSSVSANYFRTMGIALKRGREFSEFDTKKTQPVAVINETMARRYWGARNPLGSQIRHGLPDEPTAWYTIVGVVTDTVPFIGFQPLPVIFTPYSQVPEGYGDLLGRPLTVMMRTDRVNTTALFPSLQKAAATVDATLVSDIRTMDGIVSNSLADPRFRTVMISIFGTIAFWLSIMGIYGVVSAITVSETRSIGIRMALGATARDVLGLFLRRGMSVTGIGIALGLTLALPFVRIMRSVLYEVSTTDPVVYLIAIGILVSASLIAVYLPASRAARLDPAITLREQ
jgi:putative ABC transport system permease protein